MKLIKYSPVLTFLLVLVGCGEPEVVIIPPELKKARHISVNYTVAQDGSMDIRNAQQCDKQAVSLYYNQAYYERQVNTYEKWREDKIKLVKE